MKRILFYSALLLQIGIIVVLIIQSSMIDEYGKSIKLLTEKQEYYYPYDTSMDQTMFVSYEINNIPKQKWETDLALNYNEKVYVLLEQGKDDLYEVVKAGQESFTPKSNQVVLTGKYQYEDNVLGVYIVHYGIEELNRKVAGIDFKPDQLGIVTVTVAPWGQKKVIHVEQIEEN